MKRFLGITIFTLMLAVFVAACSGAPSQPSVVASDPQVAAAPQRVREAYEFAVTNPDALKNVPCYCGCVGMGHKSNYMCYIKDHNPDGSVVFDHHALGCQICVDISQDVMRLTRQNKSATEIRSYIVDKYQDAGPSTGTE